MTTKKAGSLLIISSFLLVLAMGLHPSGGSFRTIYRISKVIITSHAIAIATIPFYLAGFRGMLMKLGEKNLFALSAFYAVLIALVSGMIAAAINGIALPLFVKEIHSSPELTASAAAIFKYGLALNHAFDYLYLGGSCLAILCWSLAILQTKQLTVWLAYFGLLIAACFVILFFSAFNFLNLPGFRMIMVFNTGWIIAAGFCMRRR